MRIGIDARILQRQKRGIANYVYQLIHHIVQLDAQHEYYLYVMSSFEHNVPRGEYQPVLDSFAEYPNVRVVNIDAPNGFIWEQFRLPKAVCDDRLDLLHMTMNRAPYRCPCPCIATVHDMMEMTFFDSFFRTCADLRGRFYEWRVGWYITYMYYYLFPRCAHIITVSNSSKNDIMRMLKIPASRITVIYEAAGAEYTAQDVEKQPYLFALGGMGHKNTPAVMHAFARLPDALKQTHQLVIQGTYPHLQALADALNEPNIVLRASDFTRSIADMYRTAIGFVYVSLYEGFGLPALEAMACGTPVIASNCGSIPEITGDAALKVDPENVDSIADTMKLLLTDSHLRNQLKISGLHRASQFSWKKTAAEHLAVYQLFG